MYEDIAFENLINTQVSDNSQEKRVKKNPGNWSGILSILIGIRTARDRVRK